MRYVLIFLLAVNCGARVHPEVPQRSEPLPVHSKASWSPPSPQWQEVEVPVPASSQATSRTPSSEAGDMDAAQVKALLQKVWLAEYRINDLLGEVRPERWKLSGEARDSFNQSLRTLRTQLSSLEEWRGQFEKRTDSVYLGYETYVAINAVLPRLEGVTRGVSRYENPSLGAQYSQAGNQLFDLQQTIGPYLGLELRNQDQLFLAMQNNLANCQNQLGYAMRGTLRPAMPVRNAAPVRPERRHAQPRTPAHEFCGIVKKSEKRPEPKVVDLKKSRAPASATAQKKKP